MILLQITRLPGPDARTLWHSVASIQKLAHSPVIAALAALVAIFATTLVLAGDRDGGHVARATARESGPAGVASAYGYPVRCLSITILAGSEKYAWVDFNPSSSCGHVTRSSTAIFLRVMGAWRPVLKAVELRLPDRPHIPRCACGGTKRLVRSDVGLRLTS